jgi:hypothetical protein
MANEKIYTTASMTIEIPDVELDGVLMDSSGAGTTPDTFSYTIKDSIGADLSPPINGTLSHVAASPGTYKATFLSPPKAGRYHAHIAIIEGTSIGFYHKSFHVYNRE